MKPFFKYFGGKWRAGPRYPAPQHDLIVEPFAGAAGYATRFGAGKDVILVDAYARICGIWDYLIHVSPEEILALPDVQDDETVDDLAVPVEARDLIGFWVNSGTTAPCKSPSAWMRQTRHLDSATFWGRAARERLAAQVPQIRRWTVIQGGYEVAPDVGATWFVDPPYQDAGRFYVHKADLLDFRELGAWCENLRGQVMVCENDGADWLPFRYLYDCHATPHAKRTRKSRGEVIWTNDQHGSSHEG